MTKTLYLKDYQKPEFLIPSVDLTFFLEDTQTVVQSVLSIKKNTKQTADLVLVGRHLKLCSVRLEGELLSEGQYIVTDEDLTLPSALLPEKDLFTLEIETEINPKGNTALEGLYRSQSIYCTQCEAQGFRRITYFLDRPDVLSLYTVRIIGHAPSTDETRLKTPLLLSNGNKISEGTLEDDRPWALWKDPFPKPCYLFALVAGDLAVVEEDFKTASGRDVLLQIYVEHGNQDKTDYAMDALRRSMQWDEKVYGLEYDLDRFMIVAVSDFNMGAMENKGLNIFNAKYVLASPETATDTDYEFIEGIVAHEYFHNWTGNRVTCRDWFQLCLKEGLTVFRDQMFSADQRSHPVKRIDDVLGLRASQFPEDAGPLAHPVRPDHYIEINNFYTATVYEKGAEVCRMLHTLLGEKGFRKGIDLYFKRHDGGAVTVEDFVSAMQDANDFNLSQFFLWYQQAGTPTVTASGQWDKENGRYTLTLTQEVPPTAEQNYEKNPHFMPVKVGFVLEDGSVPSTTLLKGESLESEGIRPRTSHTLILKEKSTVYSFDGLTRKPVPSLFQNFSAPVKLVYPYSHQDNLLLLASDKDPFNRWEAGTRASKAMLLSAYDELEKTNSLSFNDSEVDDLSAGLSNILKDESLDPAFKAYALRLPTTSALFQEKDHSDPSLLFKVREGLLSGIVKRNLSLITDTYQSLNTVSAYSPDAEEAGKRALKNTLLGLITHHDKSNATVAWSQFQGANNMTDSMTALSCLVNSNSPRRFEALEAFFQRWKDNDIVLDKWFSVQATSVHDNTFDNILKLMEHSHFTWTTPNRVRSVLSAFAHNNLIHFHHDSGRGHKLIAESICKLNSINPQVASRLATSFESFRKLPIARHEGVKAILETILNHEGLSKDVNEIVQKIVG